LQAAFFGEDGRTGPPDLLPIPKSQDAPPVNPRFFPLFQLRRFQLS